MIGFCNTISFTTVIEKYKSVELYSKDTRIYLWTCSSVGRAVGLLPICRGFKSRRVYFLSKKRGVSMPEPKPFT